MEYDSLKEISHIQFRYVLNLLKLVLKLTNHLNHITYSLSFIQIIFLYNTYIYVLYFFIYENNTKKT